MDYFVRLSQAGSELDKITGNIAALRQEIARLREGEYREQQPVIHCIVLLHSVKANRRPIREEDGRIREQRMRDMEAYADYRNYLSFSMYEQVTDENGTVIRENYVDEMAGRDSQERRQ